MPTIHFGAIKWKEKLTMVFTQGKGLKIDPFEFSTHSLGNTDLKSGRVYFQILLLYFRLLFFCFWSSQFIWV